MRFKSRCLNLIVLVCLLGMCAHAQASGSTQNEGKRTQLGKSVCCSFTSNITPLLETTLAVPEPLAEDECDWFTDEHHLAYTGNRLIIAGFHLNCLQRHGSSPPVRIHTLDVVLQVDPDTGNVLHLTEWKDVSTRRNGSGDLEILPVQDGKFLVL